MRTTRTKHILALLLALVLLASMPMAALADTDTESEMATISTDPTESSDTTESTDPTDPTETEETEPTEPTDPEDPEPSESDDTTADTTNPADNTTTEPPQRPQGRSAVPTPSVSLSASATQMAPGDAVRLTATVQNAGEDTRSVSFYCDGKYMDAVDLVEGVAKLSFTTGDVGEYTLRATIHGNDGGSDSLTIVCGGQTLPEDESGELYLLLDTGADAFAGEVLALTATVMQNGQISTALDGGTMSFFVHQTQIQEVTIAGGVATSSYYVPDDPGVPYVFRAMAIPAAGYAGDVPAHISVLATSISREESAAAASLEGAQMTLSVSPDTVPFGGQVTVQAVITDAQGTTIESLPGKVSYAIDGGAQKTAAYGAPVQLTAARQENLTVTAFYNKNLTATATVTVSGVAEDTYVFGVEPAIVEVNEPVTLTIRRAQPEGVLVNQTGTALIKLGETQVFREEDTNEYGLYRFTYTPTAEGTYSVILNAAQVKDKLRGGDTRGHYTIRVVGARHEVDYQLSYGEDLATLTAGDTFTVQAVIDPAAKPAPTTGTITYVYGNQTRTLPYGEWATFTAQKEETLLTAYCAGDESVKPAEASDWLTFAALYPGFALRFDPDPTTTTFQVGDKLTVWAELTDPAGYDTARITGEFYYQINDSKDEYFRTAAYGQPVTFTLLNPGQLPFNASFRGDEFLENWESDSSWWWKNESPIHVSDGTEDAIAPEFNLILSIDPSVPLQVGQTFTARVELVSPEGIEDTLGNGFSYNFFDDDAQYVARAGYSDVATFTVTEAMLARQEAGETPFIRAHYGYANEAYSPWSATRYPTLEAVPEPVTPSLKLRVEAPNPVRPGDEITVWGELLDSGMTDAEIDAMLQIGFDYNLNDTGLRADDLRYGEKKTFIVPDDIQAVNGEIWIRGYYGEHNATYRYWQETVHLPFTTVPEDEAEFRLLAPASVYYGQTFEADIALVSPEDWKPALTGKVSYKLAHDGTAVIDQAVGTPARINADKMPGTHPLIFYYAEAIESLISPYHNQEHTIEILKAPVTVSVPVISGNATNGYTITAKVDKALTDTFEGALLPTGTASLTVDMITLETEAIAADGTVTFTYDQGALEGAVVVVEYDGDDYYQRGSSAEETVPGAGTVKLTASDTSIYLRDGVTLTATVDASLGSGTGVFYSAYGTALGTAHTVEAGGTATHTFVPYPGIPADTAATYGTYTFVFTPTGGTPVTSNVLRIDMGQIPVEITLTPSYTADGKMALTAVLKVLVTDDTSADGPTGWIYFNGDDGYIGAAQLTGDKAARTAQFIWANPPKENETFGINASYNNVGYERYKKAITYVTLGEGAESPISLAISKEKAYVGERITLTATVPDSMPLTSTNGAFYDRNGYKLTQPMTLNGNTATLSLLPAAGTQRYTFRYTPAEAGAATVRSNGVMVEVIRIPTVLTLSATPGASSAVLTAVVSPGIELSASDLTYLTGNVQFYTGNTLLGTVAINNTTKAASFLWNGAPLGLNGIRAVYTGNTYFDTSDVTGLVTITTSSGTSTGQTGSTGGTVTYTSSQNTSTNSRRSSNTGSGNTVSLGDYETPLAGASEVRLLDEMGALKETYDSSAIADYASLGYLPIRPTIDTTFFTFEFNMAEMHAFSSVYPEGYYNIETEDFVADVPFDLYAGFPGLAKYLTEKGASLDTSRLRVTIAQGGTDAVQGALTAEGTGASFVSDTWTISFTVADAQGTVYDYTPQTALEKAVSFGLYTGVVDALGAVYDAVTGALDLVDVAGNARINVEKNALTYGIVSMQGIG